MSYEEFVTEIKKYWELRSQGLKKQANRFLFQFTEHFKKDISRDEADDILFHFCRDYIDEIKFPGENLPRRHLPFQLSELLYHYFNRAKKIKCRRCAGPFRFLESTIIPAAQRVRKTHTIF